MGNELFTNIPSKIKNLVSDVRIGKIGLPDLQRPFVWKDNKVRDLFDSMLRGYPIGYVMLWESPSDYEEKKVSIGSNKKIYEEPKELVIDGQQRLTALVAAMYGVKVRDKSYNEREIKISYNPLIREFAVWTNAIDRDQEWVTKISDVFLAKENNSFTKFRRDYINGLNDARNKKSEPELTDEERDLIEDNLNALLGLEDFSVPTLEISQGADEQDVADIFVRVNSGGQNLNENNFIQTLIAVYEKDVHDKITKFCQDSRIPKDGTSYNQIMEIDPQHLVRMAVGVGFHRARLKYAYMLLRGKNLETGKYSDETRTQNLNIFKDALENVMNLNNWHSFLHCVASAGYVSDKIIASSNAVVFSYVLYLIGKLEYKVASLQLNKIISKWFFMSAITYFYTGSTESEVERQFADLRNVHTSDEFVAYLEKNIASRFTDDYFNLTLPNELNTSSAISPAWYGYIASQIVLNTPLLFGTSGLAKYLLPGVNGTKNAIDKHHIFPKNYLTQFGYTTDRDRNQVANFTYLDYVTNIDISDDSPVNYIERYKNKLGDSYKTHCENHCLPKDFEKLDYMEFLNERRMLMAQLIKKAFMVL
ncbi:MAG: DUF262 domain-containing protein [Treponema sp.]|nr:DUF262 domain-containing protein [Treponema sp.]